MTSIIPLRPFGRDPKDLQSLEATVKRVEGESTGSLHNQTLLPLPLVFPSDFSIESVGNFIQFRNLPFNTVVDSFISPHGKKYVQGVWSKMYLEREYAKFKVPGSRHMRKYLSLAEWGVVTKKYNVIIPSLPLYFALMAGVYYLDGSGNRSANEVRAAHEVRELCMQDVKGGGAIYFDSVYKPVENKVVHGMISGIPPFQYKLLANGASARSLMFCSNNDKLVNDVLSNIFHPLSIESEAPPRLTDRFNKLSWGMNLELERHKLYFQFLLDGSTSRAVRLIRADPSDYRVI